MPAHETVSNEDWIAARKRLLGKEKQFTRLRDDLARERRALPWTKVEKPYVFDGPQGEETLSDLFADRRQLIIQHFMFDPAWDSGCRSCSFWADGYNGFFRHIEARDTTFVAVSRAPLDKLAAFQKRMGWSFKWLSSLRCDFNHDFQVSESEAEKARGEAYYNYALGQAFGPERPGISVFYRDGDDGVFHTYSCYARGLDMMNAAYHYLDLTPKGRDEAGLSFSQAWVRLHDEYEPQ